MKADTKYNLIHGSMLLLSDASMDEARQKAIDLINTYGRNARDILIIDADTGEIVTVWIRQQEFVPMISNDQK